MKREKVQIHQLRVGPSWMDLIVIFLKDDILPKEKGKANKVRRKAPRFWLSEDQKLYTRFFSRPYLLCIHLEAVKLLFRRVARRDLWKPYRRLILVSPGPYLGILVTQYAKRSIRIHEKV